MELRDWTLPGPSWLTGDIHDVAKFFGVSADTVRRWIAAGQFPAGQRHGAADTWSGADVAAYVQLRGRFSGIPEEGEPQTGGKQPQTGGK